jgi:carboxymethylenebutenolidase
MALTSHRGHMPVVRLLALPLILAACTNGASPRLLTGAGVAPAVWGVLEVPASPGPHPGVILLPGSSGWRPDYARFAKAFADSGFVALAIDYYGETGRGESHEEENRNWPAWQATIRNAVTYLGVTPAVGGRPIALVGYSRGAMLAISVGASDPPIAAIVDFYGAGSDDDPPDNQISHFPPLLILHGDADSNIPVALAYRLYDRLHARGGDVEMHVYPNAEHGFNAPWAPGYSQPQATDSWARTIGFLKHRLKA